MPVPFNTYSAVQRVPLSVQIQLWFSTMDARFLVLTASVCVCVSCVIVLNTTGHSDIAC